MSGGNFVLTPIDVNIIIYVNIYVCIHGAKNIVSPSETIDAIAQWSGNFVLAIVKYEKQH